MHLCSYILGKPSSTLKRLETRVESRVICPLRMSFKLSSSFCMLLMSRSKSSLLISLGNRKFRMETCFEKIYLCSTGLFSPSLLTIF